MASCRLAARHSCRGGSNGGLGWACSVTGRDLDLSPHFYFLFLSFFPEADCERWHLSCHAVTRLGEAALNLLSCHTLALWLGLLLVSAAVVMLLSSLKLS